MTPSASLWQQISLVAAGGALGAVLRFLVGASLLRSLGGGFPWGTLTVNLVGALAAGFLLVWLEGRAGENYWRAFLIVGVLGGLTTFSSLMLETLVFQREARSALIPLYLGISLTGGMLMVWLGARLAGMLRDFT